MPEQTSRHRLLPALNSIKEDLQEIYASAEANYQNTRILNDHLPELSEKLLALRSLIEDYQRQNSNNHEEHEEQLNEIIDFCNSISESFAKLVEALTNNIEYTSEEHKKIRNILMSLANSYKNMQGSILSIKASLEINTDKQKQIDAQVNQSSKRVDDIHRNLDRSADMFKGINDEELATFIPRLDTVINEILEEKGYYSNGRKKESINAFFEMIWTQFKHNVLNMILVGILWWALNAYVASRENTDSVKKNYQQQIEDQQKQIDDLTNKLNSKNH